MQTGSFEEIDGIAELDETFGGKARNIHKNKRAEKITGTGGKDKIIVLGVLSAAARCVGLSLLTASALDAAPAQSHNGQKPALGNGCPMESDPGRLWRLLRGSDRNPFSTYGMSGWRRLLAGSHLWHTWTRQDKALWPCSQKSTTRTSTETWLSSAAAFSPRAMAEHTAEDGERRAGPSPLERFESLTKRLLRVFKDDMREAEVREAGKRRTA